MASRGRDIDDWPERLSRITWSRSGVEQELRFGERIPAFALLTLRIERFGLRHNHQDLRLGLLLCVFDRFTRRLVFKLRAD
jgi:hypothetical protein